MNRTPMPTPDSDIETQALAWLDADAEVRDLHRELAEIAGGDDDRWQTLLEAQARLRSLDAALGRAVGRWIAGGGTLDLIPGTSELDPVLESEDDASRETVAEGADASSVAPNPPTVEVEPGPELTVAEAPAFLGAERQVLPFEPAPEVRPAPAPRRGPKATLDQLAELRTVGIGGRRGRDDAAHLQRARDHVGSLLPLLQPPVTRDRLPAIRDWLKDIHLVDPLPNAEIHALATAMTATLRSLQSKRADSEIDACFPLVSAWSKERRPGPVHGLARTHAPKTGSWYQDAERALAGLLPPEAPPTPSAQQPTLDEVLQAFLDRDPPKLDAEALRAAVLGVLRLKVPPGHPRLLRAVADRYEDLKGHGELAPVRKALKEATKQERTSTPRVKDAPPADWPFWHLTRGKIAVITGGDPRAGNRDRIRDAFGFARVEWPEHDASTLERLAERAASGTVDVFLFNRFGGHIMDDKILPVVKSDLSRWVRIDSGYGVAAVRSAMEQHWAGLAEGAECAPGGEG